jgi:ribosomal-protein-alanine acetyltransferase
MALTHQFFTTPGTAPLLSELHKNCFNEPWSEQAFDDLLKLQGTVAHLIQQDKNPIGFTLYQSILDEAEILTLGVLPKFQDQKIGEKMLRSGISHLHDIGVNRIFLEVSEDNKAAQRLYEKLEFLTVGRRANYYKIAGLATDALILEYKHK